MMPFERLRSVIAVTALKHPIRESQISFVSVDTNLFTNEIASFAQVRGWEDFCTNQIFTFFFNLGNLPCWQRCLGAVKMASCHCFAAQTRLGISVLCFAGV